MTYLVYRNINHGINVLIIIYLLLYFAYRTKISSVIIDSDDDMSDDDKGDLPCIS